MEFPSYPNPTPHGAPYHPKPQRIVQFDTNPVEIDSAVPPSDLSSLLPPEGDWESPRPNSAHPVASRVPTPALPQQQQQQDSSQLLAPSQPSEQYTHPQRGRSPSSASASDHERHGVSSSPPQHRGSIEQQQQHALPPPEIHVKGPSSTHSEYSHATERTHIRHRYHQLVARFETLKFAYYTAKICTPLTSCTCISTD